MGRDKHSKKPIDQGRNVAGDIHPDDERFSVTGGSHKDSINRRTNNRKGRGKSNIQRYMDDAVDADGNMLESIWEQTDPDKDERGRR